MSLAHERSQRISRENAVFAEKPFAKPVRPPQMELARNYLEVNAMDDNGIATLVIQHHVNPIAKGDYESWIKKIAAEGQHFKGHMGVNVIRPHGTSSSYTIVLRFDSHENLQGWIDSEARRLLVQEARTLLVAEEDLELQTGLEYWFTPPHTKQLHARAFKQFLITLSAIFPLTIVVPWLLQPLSDAMPFFANFWVAKLLIAIAIVWLMVYVIMPRYTRLVAGWLFR